MSNYQTNRVGWASDEKIDWTSAHIDSETVEIPDVKGWRVMVMPLDVIHKTSGGVILSDDTREKEQLVVSVGRVLSMGDEAYNRGDMGNPWCEVGQLVGFGKYAGKKFMYKGIPLIILNDDEIICTFPEGGDPVSQKEQEG